MYILNLFLVSFGELEIPQLLIIILILFTIAIFSSVIISTYKLIEGLISDSD